MREIVISRQLFGRSHRPAPVQERCGKQNNTLPRVTEHAFGGIGARRGLINHRTHFSNEMVAMLTFPECGRIELAVRAPVALCRA